MKEKILFIINPISGTNKKKDMPVLIDQYLDKQKYEIEIAFTERGGHATELAQKSLKNGVHKIIAVGGDGTANEVAKALLHSEASLGIIPSGSGNGLARHLLLPLSTAKALSLLNSCRTIAIDSCEINKIPFFVTAGIGFDAHIGNLFASKTKRGFATYFKTACKEFYSYKSEIYNLEVDNQIYQEKAFLITFANASQYGNNAYISPRADVMDGLLDVCILGPFPKYKIAQIGYRLFNRTMDQSAYMKLIQTDKIKIVRKNEGLIHADGEPHVMGKELHVKILAGSLKVLVN